ncbi:MAG: tannase/feruloyl esterase family alpha/beta hydrolase [Croceibacterium sp.]
MIGKTAAALTASTIALAFATPASAKDCASLASLRVGGKVTSATLVPAGGFQQPAGPGLPPGVAGAAYKEVPAFCRVQATLTPTKDSDIKVEVWLPATGWNGKFVAVGNGVWAGQLSYSAMADPLKQGYAVATTDTGHTGSGLDAKWAVGHTEKVVDFGYRAVHGMVVTAKQAVNAFYGAAPKKSYWNSCSTGGRQGLMEAHRYPTDFDAISAMAPANPMTGLMVQSMWVGWAPKHAPGAALSPATMGMVHAAVLKACDKKDGLEDGLIEDPRHCGFDPAVLQCKPGQTASCLAPAQVDALHMIYGGVRDAKGKVIRPGWPLGSEMQLALLIGGNEPFPVATSYFRDLVFASQPGWDWKVSDYGAELAAAKTYGSAMLDLTPTGLGPFFARGGKLLMSHGWTDGLIPANNSVEFYTALTGALPAVRARNQLRLFMVPGMDHCGGGEGASTFDTLGTIDSWASSGKAPERIVATRTPSPNPNAPKLPPISRPLCPYPLIAKYQGAGDVNSEKSFVCGRAETASTASTGKRG